MNNPQTQLILAAVTLRQAEDALTDHKLHPRLAKKCRDQAAECLRLAGFKYEHCFRDNPDQTTDKDWRDSA